MELESGIVRSCCDAEVFIGGVCGETMRFSISIEIEKWQKETVMAP